MRESIFFFLTYSCLSFLTISLFQVSFHPLSNEVFSYAIWLYLIYTIFGAAIFLISGIILQKFESTLKARIIIYAFLCLFVLNVIPFIGERKILTYDVIKGLLIQNVDQIDIGLHLIAMASFFFAYVVNFHIKVSSSSLGEDHD